MKDKLKNSYIEIKLMNYSGSYKIIKVNSYFDNKSLNYLDFCEAIKLLKEEQDKSLLPFR